MRSCEGMECKYDEKTSIECRRELLEGATDAELVELWPKFLKGYREGNEFISETLRTEKDISKSVDEPGIFAIMRTNDSVKKRQFDVLAEKIKAKSLMPYNIGYAIALILVQRKFQEVFRSALMNIDQKIEKDRIAAEAAAN